MADKDPPLLRTLFTAVVPRATSRLANKAANLAYIGAVEKHIAAAEVYAAKIAGMEPVKSATTHHEKWCAVWDKAFHRRMDELCARNGLRRQAWQGAEEVN